MWRAIFIGCLTIAVAEVVKDSNSDSANVSKRQTGRSNTVVYGATPGQYSVQPSDRSNLQQQQVSADYQQQSELYVIGPNRKPATSPLAYSSETPRRPQYIQLSPLQLQPAPQQLQQLALSQQQHQQQQHIYEPETDNSAQTYFRPSLRIPQETRPQQESAVNPVQYAASAIVDSQVGSFERELAQLVAANRAQEQKYNAGIASSAKKPVTSAPQQYLKEVTRPTPKPLSANRVTPANVGSHPQIQYQPITVPQQIVPASIYRYFYQPEQIQSIPQVAGNKQVQEPHYVRSQLQQYLQQVPQQPQVVAHSQPQHQALRFRDEDRVHLSSSRLQSANANEAVAPSRSTIFVSQSTPVKKAPYVVAEREEEQKQVPVVRIPAQRNRPLTQEEFQQLLQSGGYTATLVPSDDPNSPHQEYLLHPSGAQRQLYTNDYLQQIQQRPAKKRPVYNVQQA